MPRSAPSERRAVALLLALVVTTAALPCPSAAEPWGTADDWTDYGLITGGALLVGVARLWDRPRLALIGPSYDPAAPLGVFDAAHAGRIGRPYAPQGVGELVPTASAGVGVALVALAIAADTFVRQARGADDGARHSHDALVGFAEGLSLTMGLVELLKPVVGRLRPDFQDRARRYHCQHEPVAGLDCSGVPSLDADPARALDLLDDGRKSMPSGHSASAFYAATYALYYLGGRAIWGAGATATSRGVGLLSSGLLLGAASFVAASRFDDGRHNLTDIAVGASLGVAFASFAYWRRFDGDGRSVRARRGDEIALTGRGLAVKVGF